MDKKEINVEELIQSLRDSASTIFTAAIVLEEQIRKDKFNLFVWETLGNETMKHLICAYREQNGMDGEE